MNEYFDELWGALLEVSPEYADVYKNAEEFSQDILNDDMFAAEIYEWLEEKNHSIVKKYNRESHSGSINSAREDILLKKAYPNVDFNKKKDKPEEEKKETSIESLRDKVNKKIQNQSSDFMSTDSMYDNYGYVLKGYLQEGATGMLQPGDEGYEKAERAYLEERLAELDVEPLSATSKIQSTAKKTMSQAIDDPESRLTDDQLASLGIKVNRQASKQTQKELQEAFFKGNPMDFNPNKTRLNISSPLRGLKGSNFTQALTYDNVKHLMDTGPGGNTWGPKNIEWLQENLGAQFNSNLYQDYVKELEAYQWRLNNPNVKASLMYTSPDYPSKFRGDDGPMSDATFMRAADNLVYDWMNNTEKGRTFYYSWMAQAADVLQGEYKEDVYKNFFSGNQVEDDMQMYVRQGTGEVDPLTGIERLEMSYTVGDPVVSEVATQLYITNKTWENVVNQISAGGRFDKQDAQQALEIQQEGWSLKNEFEKEFQELVMSNYTKTGIEGDKALQAAYLEASRLMDPLTWRDGALGKQTIKLQNLLKSKLGNQAINIPVTIWGFDPDTGKQKLINVNTPNITPEQQKELEQIQQLYNSVTDGMFTNSSVEQKLSDLEYELLFALGQISGQGYDSAFDKSLLGGAGLYEAGYDLKGANNMGELSGIVHGDMADISDMEEWINKANNSKVLGSLTLMDNPLNNPLINFYNSKLNTYRALGEAYVMNYNPVETLLSEREQLDQYEEKNDTYLGPAWMKDVAVGVMTSKETTFNIDEYTQEDFNYEFVRSLESGEVDTPYTATEISKIKNKYEQKYVDISTATKVGRTLPTFAGMAIEIATIELITGGGGTTTVAAKSPLYLQRLYRAWGAGRKTAKVMAGMSKAFVKESINLYGSNYLGKQLMGREEMPVFSFAAGSTLAHFGMGSLGRAWKLFSRTQRRATGPGGALFRTAESAFQVTPNIVKMPVTYTGKKFAQAGMGVTAIKTGELTSGLYDVATTDLTMKEMWKHVSDTDSLIELFGTMLAMGAKSGLRDTANGIRGVFGDFTKLSSHYTTKQLNNSLTNTWGVGEGALTKKKVFNKKNFLSDWKNSGEGKFGGGSFWGSLEIAAKEKILLKELGELSSSEIKKKYGVETYEAAKEVIKGQANALKTNQQIQFYRANQSSIERQMYGEGSMFNKFKSIMRRYTQNNGAVDLTDRLAFGEIASFSKFDKVVKEVMAETGATESEALAFVNNSQALAMSVEGHQFKRGGKLERRFLDNTQKMLDISSQKEVLKVQLEKKLISEAQYKNRLEELKELDNEYLEAEKKIVEENQLEIAKEIERRAKKDGASKVYIAKEGQTVAELAKELGIERKDISENEYGGEYTKDGKSVILIDKALASKAQTRFFSSTKTKQYRQALNKLNERFEAGKISKEKYEERKQKLADNLEKSEIKQNQGIVQAIAKGEGFISRPANREVIFHEKVHPLVERLFSSKDPKVRAQGREIVEDFINILKQKGEYDYVWNKLKDHSDVQGNKNYRGAEWFTVFGELVKSGRLDALVESTPSIRRSWKNLASRITKFIKGESAIKDYKLSDGASAREFIKNFAKGESKAVKQAKAESKKWIEGEAAELELELKKASVRDAEVEMLDIYERNKEDWNEGGGQRALEQMMPEYNEAGEIVYEGVLDKLIGSYIPYPRPKGWTDKVNDAFIKDVYADATQLITGFSEALQTKSGAKGFFAYVNSFLRYKTLNVLKEIDAFEGGNKKSLDSMKEEVGFDLAAPEASTEVYKPKTSTEVAKDIKLSETAIKELDSQLSELDSPALIEAFDTPAGPNQTISPFIREFRKDFGKKGQKAVAKSMGKGQAYKDYLYENMGEIINNVPIGYVSRNFPYLVTKGETGTVGTTGRDLRWTSGPKGMKIKEGLTEADRKQFVYDLTEVGRLSTKKNALAYQLADSYGVKKFTETLQAQRNNAAEILKLEGDFELTQNEYRENKISKEDFQERRSQYVSEMSRLLKESNMMDNFNKNLSPESVITPETIAQKLSQQIEVSNFRKSATLNKEFRKFAEEMAESTGELPDNFYLEAQENFQSKKPLLVVDLLSRKKDIILSRKDFREAFQKVYGEVEFVKGKKLSKQDITKIAHEMFDQSAYVEKHYEVARQRRLEDVKNNKQSREELMFNLERQFDKAFENIEENVRLKQQLGVAGTAKELMKKAGQIIKNILHEENYWIKRLNNSNNKVNEIVAILKGNLGHYASAGGPRGHRQQFFSGKPDVFAEMNKTFKDLGLDIEIEWDTAADGSLKAKSTRILKNGKEVVSGAELADRLFQPSQKAESKWLKLTDQEWIDKNPKEFEALRKEFVERGEAAAENKQAIIDKIEYDFASFKLGQIDANTLFLSLDQLNTNMIGALRAGAPLHSVMKPFKGDIVDVLTLEHMRAAQVLVDGLVSISRRADSWKGINEKGLETNNLKETVDYKFSDSALDMINKLYEKYNTAIITQEKLGVTAGESVDALITSVGNKTKEPFVARGYDGELIYPRLINEATAGSPFFRSMIDLQKLFETGKVSEAEYGKTLAELARMNNKKSVVEADKVELESSGIYNKSSLKGKTVPEMVESTSKMDQALDNSRKINPKVKKARVFDFDDTVARTSSKVFYDKPNLTGKPTPKRKAIFMIGGPGSGKTNIGKGLQLGREGWKVVNQDIFIEGAKKEAGLPESETGYTAEQRSQRAKIGAAGMKAAKNKLKQYTEAGEGMVIDGTGASYKATMKKVNDLKAKGYEVHMIHAKTSAEAAKQRNKNRPERSLPSWIVGKTQKSVEKNIEQYRKDFGDKFMEIDTEQIEYGKPLPKEFVDMVKSNIYKNERGILTAEEFAKEGSRLTTEGAKMDFSDFNRVVDGKKGPLFDLMKKMKEAEGDRDMFILTARSQESATAIHEFLKANGIDIPLDHIKGLGNSTGEAKAEWLVDKAAEGYNDFYFADDAIANVEAVKKALEPIDVKSQVQQARMNKSSVDMNETFNKYLEAKTGIEWQKEFSPAKASVRGAKKGKYKFWIPPSASDFSGLMDATLGKGKEGEAQRAFYNEVLYKPYSRAQRSVSRDRTQLMADFKALKKELNVPKDLRKITESGFSKEQAVRVHLWNKLGMEIPGLSKTDLAELNKIVSEDATLTAFADQILSITKGDGYAKPGKHWLAGTITSDFMNLLNTTKRSKYLQEWQANVDVLFSKANLNKLEAAFGSKYREALENTLARMKAGKNRIQGGNRLSDRVLDYINNAQGTIMFFNMRSAVLQSLSSTNFLNFGFNNPVKAGKAFANQKQYWKDFMEIMNSEYLVDRRNGLKINIAENEIADAAATGKNKAKAVINYILEKGYLPTKFMDSFAIASGGATWYRNRINDLIKKGKSEAEAKEIATEEFIEISEKSQQSSDPSKISQQQSSDMGRILLQFVNTPMQYARLQKAEALDILNRRGNPLKKAAKIMYYGVVQNMWFNLMQQGLFAIGFDEDMGDADIENKVADGVNGMADSILRGLGFGGMTVSVLKNFLIDVYERSGKKNPKYKESLFKLLEFSPAIKSKFSKLSSVAWMMEDKVTRDQMKTEGFSLDNPAWKAAAKILSATVNLPLDRAYQKMENIQFAMDEETEAWQSVFAWLGWPEYQLTNMQDKEAKRQKEKDDLHYRTAIEDPSKYTKEEQIDILKQHGYTDEDIKKMKNEGTRVATIKKAEQDNEAIYTSEKSRGKKPAKKEEKTYSPYVKEEEASKLSGESDEDRRTTLNVKKYRDMNKAEQEQKLWDLGYTKKYIRSLNTEDKRVDVLLREIENDSIPARLKKSSPIPKSQRTKQQHRLYDLNKQAQVDTLLSLGLSDSLVNALTYEADRVKKIEELYEERNK